jgi:hypothetical protein
LDIKNEKIIHNTRVIYVMDNTIEKKQMQLLGKREERQHQTLTSSPGREVAVLASSATSISFFCPDLHLLSPLHPDLSLFLTITPVPLHPDYPML